MAEISQERLLQAQLGGGIGSLVGLIGATITIILFMSLPPWTKFFIGIGGIGGALITGVQTYGYWKMYKAHAEAMKMFNQLKSTPHGQISIPDKNAIMNETPTEKDYIG